MLPNDEKKDSERSSQNLRTRQSVLEKISARPKSTRPSSARESQPARKTLSTHRTPRNVPVSLREPPARSYGFAQHPSSSRPTSRNVQAGASDAAQVAHPVQPPSSSRPTSRNVQAGPSDAAQASHPAQPHPHAQTSQSGLRDSSARSYGFAQAPSSSRPTSRNVKAGTSDAAQVSHPAQPMPSVQTLQAGPRERLAASASTFRPSGNAKPAPSHVAAHSAQGPASPDQVQSVASTSTSSVGRNAKPAHQDLAGERSQARERKGNPSSAPHSSPHALSRQSSLTARWARPHKSCPCGGGRRFQPRPRL